MQSSVGNSLRSHVAQLRWLQGAIIMLPIGGRLIGSKSVFLNPPLGGLSDALSFSFILIGLFAILPWLFKSKSSAKKAAWLSAFCAFILLVAYASCLSVFVVQVDIPSADKVIRVSIGTERTTFAKDNFAGRTDAEMLKQTGFGEEQVQHLWTGGTILVARLSLLCSYLCFLISLNFCIGSFARISGLEAAKR